MKTPPEARRLATRKQRQARAVRRHLRRMSPRIVLPAVTLDEFAERMEAWKRSPQILMTGLEAP